MTAPQHTTQPNTGQPNTGQPNTAKKDSEPLSKTKLQRCWFVTLGLLGGLGFVTSHVSLARAESDFLADDYATSAESITPVGTPSAAASTAASPIIYTAADAVSPVAEPTFEVANVQPPAAPISVSEPTATFVEPAPAFVPPVASAPAVSAVAPSASAAPAAAPATPTPSIKIDVQPARTAHSAVKPGVTKVAPPTFASVKKSVATKTARRSPLAGLVEAGAIAGPLSAYVGGTQVLTAEGIASETPAAVPDIYPEGSAAPPIVDIAPAAEPAAPVQPTELVPAELPEGANLPEEYNSVFVDPTDYSVGATQSPNAQSPDVVVSEQSTGCEFTVGGDRAVPNGACGAAPVPAPTAAPGGSYAQSPVNAPSYSAPAASSAPAVNVGPVSFSASGIRFNGSTTAAGREYLNRSIRPLVNLQAAEQFIFPLAIPAPITSLFGFRIHPISGDQRFHAGTDIGAEQGTPVLAAQAGTVVSADYAGGYGLMVVLDHKVEKTELQSRYAHLSDILVKPGDRVKKGDVIGLVGSTGNSTGPHLHFEMAQKTADGWVLVNPDGLIQDSLTKLVKALNSPMQAMAFNLSDFNLNLSALKTAPAQPSSSVTLPPLPGQNGIPFRPAQPNAS
ncbi:MAG: M23 family metallopeptidase [Phormidesmis sp.]